MQPRGYWPLVSPDRRNTGIDFISTRHLPDNLQGCIFWGGFMSRTVQMHKLSDEHSGFSATVIPDLLSSSRPEFRPVDGKVGPDGAIYICDWYNPIIGHYQASYRDPNRDHTHGRIWRITAKDRPLVKQPNLKAMKPAELLAQLRSPERWTRQQAKRLLFDQPTESTVAALDGWLAKLDPADPLYEHLLFEAIGIYEAHEIVKPDMLDKLLNANDYRVRAYGTRVVGNWGSRLKDPLTLLRERTRDEHPRVRLEAVVACGNLGVAPAIEVATQVLDFPRDRFIDYGLHQAVHALKEVWQPALVRGELKFDNRSDRLRFLLEADGTRDVASYVRKLAGSKELDENSRQQLLAFLVNVGKADDLRYAFDQARRSPLVLNELAAVAYRTKLVPTGKPSESLKALLSDRDDATLAAAVRLAGAWKAKELMADVRRLLQGEKTAVAVRQAAIEAIVQLEGRDALPLVTPFAGSKHPHAVRADAVGALSQVDVDLAAKHAAELIVNENDETQLSDLMTPLLNRKGGSDALAKALASIKFPIDPAKLAHRVLSKAGRSDVALVDVVNKAIGLTTPKFEYQESLVKQLADASRLKGNADRGRVVFNSKLANCVSCHRVGDKGGDIGPDLLNVGTRLSPELLVESILWPNRQVREGYMAIGVLTSDGRSLTGYKIKETPDEIHLRDTTANKIVRIARNDIEEMKDFGSLMPEGLTVAMTRDELHDLIRFLSELGKKAEK